MTLPHSWILTILITLAAVLWMASGAFRSESTDSVATESVEKSSLLKVRVKHSVAQSMTNRLVLQGQTLAERKVTISAETGGVIKSVQAQRGQQVKSGDGLMKLHLDARKVRLGEARSLLKQRKTEYDAVLSLKKSGYQAETEVARAKAALDSARTTLLMAELELERVSIKSPIDGVVDNRLVEVGDFVARGDPVAVVVDLDPIRVVAQVSERYLGQVATGTQGEVRLLDGTVTSATVSFVGAIARSATRTFPVEMEIPNPNGQIIEGITAELHLPIKEIVAHKLAPSVLSLLDNGALSIKALADDNTVISFPVTVLGDSQEGIWLGGLPQQLNIIVVGHEFVKAGNQVLPVMENNTVTISPQ